MKIINESRIPEVGPFYVIDGAVFADTESYRDVEEINSNRDSNNTHYNYWELLQQLYKELREIDYDYYPRGRVVYNSVEDKFYVYLDKCLSGMKTIRNIISELNLPQRKVVVRSDEHYQCHSCNKNYVNITENNHWDDDDSQ